MKHIADMVFPVLKFNKRGSHVSWGGNIDTIANTNYNSLKHGQYEDAFFIDSTGKRYEVISVRILRISKPYIHLLLFDPSYRIDIELKDPEQLIIDEIRDLTIAALRSEKITRKTLYNKLQRANNVVDIICYLDETFYGKHGLET